MPPIDLGAKAYPENPKPGDIHTVCGRRMRLIERDCGEDTWEPLDLTSEERLAWPIPALKEAE